MSAANESIAQNSASVTSTPKQRLDDVGWEYGFPCDPNRPLRVKCKLCDKEMGGGVNRLKQHIAHVKGNVTGCPKSTDEDKIKCKKSLDSPQEKKAAKRAREEEVRNDVTIEEKESAVVYIVLVAFMYQLV